MSSTTTTILFFVAAMIGVWLIVKLYFWPSNLAIARRHPHAQAIFVVNLLLGWTIWGWVVALIWALVPVAPPNRL